MAKIEGTIAMDGMPMSTEIVVLDAETKAVAKTGQSTAQGDYSIDIFKTGDYYVMAIPPDGYRPLIHGPVFVENAGDPHWDNVAALLHFDGDYTDETGKTWTAVGDAQIVEDSFFGSGALYTPPTNQSALISTHSDFALGKDNFTVEMFLNTPASSSTAVISVAGLLIYFTAGRYTLFHSTASNFLQPSASVPLNTYHHIAFQRTGAVFSIYANGVKLDEVSRSIDLTSNEVRVGYFNPGNPGRCVVDELRITKGVARYTADFTPPTEPFPAG